MVKIKTISEVKELQKTIAIQKNAWGFDDLDVENHYLMTRVQKYGGLVQGLYLDNQMIGFSYALIGKRQDEYIIYSHMTAVIKEHQGKGYGFRLKKAQRKAVLDMGYDVIEWNFDPIESSNAYFNFHRLGIISREYERNIYGKGESGLHKGLPTDRLIATWELNSNRVIHKMKSRDPRIMEDISDHQIANFREEVSYVEIPRDIRAIKKNDMRTAFEWRMKTRELIEQALANNRVVKEVVFSTDRQNIFYKLMPE